MQTQTDPTVSPNLAAGLILAAIPHIERLGLHAPTATEVIEATGAGRTRAYAIRAAVDELLPSLQKRPGRPHAVTTAGVDTSAITRAILDYLIAHPGAVTAQGTRREYSRGFQAEVLERASMHPELGRDQLALAVRVPRGTLDDWFEPRSPRRDAAADQGGVGGRAPDSDRPPDSDPAATARIASILDAWKGWDGGFSAFGALVREQLDIPWGDTRIGTILAIHSNRRPRTRPGRRPDEKALRGAFLTFFPGAQWTEDGTLISIEWCGERFTFNWQLVVDTASAACVGANVSDTETTAAVTSAYQDAVTTTGKPPLALNTDNATENDGPGMSEVLGDTRHIHATPGRPQNDCHVEGTFGLFQQTAPRLSVDGKTPREMARAVLGLLLTIWMRAINHRPRASRGGKSRADLYREAAPTAEQIAMAKAAIAEIQRQHDQAEKTRRERANPTARALLDAFFATRGWEDSNGHLRDAIAGYPIDDVIAGTAIFEGKAQTGRLPPDVGPQYLLGITRNIAGEREGHAIAEALWRRRLEARDDILARLVAARDLVLGDARTKLQVFTERVLRADSSLQRIVWQDAIAETIRREPEDHRKDHFDRLTRTVHAEYRVHKRERVAIVRDIAERIIPVI